MIRDVTGFYVSVIGLAIVLIGLTLWGLPRYARLPVVHPIPGQSEEDTRRRVTRAATTITIAVIVVVTGVAIALAATH